MKLHTLLTLFLIGAVGTACNSSGSGEVTIDVDPSGTWKVTFTELVDECDVIAPDDDGVFFESEEVITSTESGFTVEADELIFGSIDGSLRSNNSLIAEGDFSGDIFGAGFSCTLSERLAYNDLTDTSANVVYEVFINCDDGTRCDSLFRAQADRIQ